MLRNINIGQYIARDSIIHKLDARIKIIITILMITALFLSIVSRVIFFCWLSFS